MDLFSKPNIQNTPPPPAAETVQQQVDKEAKANNVRAQILRDLNATSQQFKAPTGLRL